MQAEQEKPPLRTRVYIDGYNLYYGCLKNTCLKWLDIQVLFSEHILPSILITKDGSPAQFELLKPSIKYFTAQILEQAAKADDSLVCQSQYHAALKKKYDGEIQIIEGYYSMNEAKAKIVDIDDRSKWPKYCESVTVWKLEEKQSDVNMALQAYHDAITGEVDHVVIVTNDTDIAPAMKMIREHTNVKIGLVIPTRNHQRPPNEKLDTLSHWTRNHITEAELLASQLPRVIHGGKRPVSKPDTWYPNQAIFQQILLLGDAVLNKRSKVYKWLSEENPLLGNQVPLDMIETEDGANAVLTYMKDYIAGKAKKGL